MRWTSYFLNTLREVPSDADVIIFDRFIYDELANLDLSTLLGQEYARTMLQMIPRPDLAFVLDADPAQAQARKPEYPLEFIQSNRAAYLKLARLADWITLVEPSSVQEAGEKILRDVAHALEKRSSSPNLSRAQMMLRG